MKTITKDKAAEMLQETNGKFFTAIFIKKDGSSRTINARLKVKKHLTGGSLKYEPSNYSLLPCYDLKAEGYRMVNLKTLKQIKINQKTFKIK